MPPERPSESSAASRGEVSAGPSAELSADPGAASSVEPSDASSGDALSGGDSSRGELRSSPGFELLFLLQKFTTEAERYSEVVRRQHGLARNDIHAINAVVEADRTGGTTTPGGLRERLVLSSAAMTAVLDRLEASGHLRREHSAEDRRQVLLSATPSARETGREMFDPMVEHMLPVLADYGPEQLAFLSEAIQRLTTAIAEARAELSARGVGREGIGGEG
ncbi:MarR family winged helix-turn-helix transcriptional regulator [Sinomonas albida]|uniref:MarR family winged helix-turn-helix transcriptional regulator n=1 Tax=Sinomonas albida TaxID=369942 RepID=UPI00301A815C